MFELAETLIKEEGLQKSVVRPQVSISCGTKFHSDHVAYQMDRHGMLGGVLTSHPPKYYLNRVPLKKEKVRFLPPVFLLAYGLRKVFGPSNGLTHWLNYRLPVVYDRLAAKAVGKADVLLTWAWSGLETIRVVKKNGGLTIVEECGSFSRFQNALLGEEYGRLGLTFSTTTPKFIEERQWKEAQEADYLLCPSKHVANSFIQHGIEPSKCAIIPYGANVSTFKPNGAPKQGFQVLFVGTVGVRKGVIYLLQALELLKEKVDIDCTIIGGLEPAFAPIFDKYKHLCRYISHVDHHQLVDYYNQASVFVFPSLDEGMALVQLEALACGLPVICTTNSGGDSVIEEGIEGFVVPVRDAAALAEKIHLLATNPPMQEQMAEKARAKALQFSWERYGDALSSFIQTVHRKKTNLA